MKWLHACTFPKRGLIKRDMLVMLRGLINPDRGSSFKKKIIMAMTNVLIAILVFLEEQRALFDVLKFRGYKDDPEDR